MGRRWQSPFSPKPVGLPEVHEPMVLLALTEFVANSAAFVYFTAGALRRNISSEAVRGGSGTARRCCPTKPCLGGGPVATPTPLTRPLCCLPAPAALPHPAEDQEPGGLLPTGG